jgi:hypothetical protein
MLLFVSQKLVRSLAMLTLSTISVLGVIAGFPALHQSNGDGSQPDQLISLQALSLQPALAEAIRANEVWQRVYTLDPSLPRENQYVSRETGKVSEDNTLVSRLIRYHIYVKGRPPNYRLDWKLTLADYLGANDLMVEARYPGADFLKTNPMQGDIAAIKAMTRAQRDALVQALVTVFTTPEATSEPTTPSATPTSPQPPVPSPSPSPSPSPQATPESTGVPLLREPQPGDARLLNPQ